MEYSDIMTTNYIRERITELRLQKGVSEREMSLAMGKGHAYIHNIVAGASLPTMENFISICEYFNITPFEFFDCKINNPTQSREIINELERLCNGNMEKILILLKIITPYQFNAIFDIMDKYGVAINYQRKK